MHLIRPDRRLYFSDMRLLKQRHADPALPDTAAHRERKLVFQQFPVKRQRSTFLASGDCKLPTQRFGVHTNAHGTDLKRMAEHRIPDQDIPI